MQASCCQNGLWNPAHQTRGRHCQGVSSSLVRQKSSAFSSCKQVQSACGVCCAKCAHLVLGLGFGSRRRPGQRHLHRCRQLLGLLVGPGNDATMAAIYPALAWLLRSGLLAITTWAGKPRQAVGRQLALAQPLLNACLWAHGWGWKSQHLSAPGKTAPARACVQGVLKLR